MSDKSEASLAEIGVSIGAVMTELRQCLREAQHQGNVDAMRKARALYAEASQIQDFLRQIEIAKTVKKQSIQELKEVLRKANDILASSPEEGEDEIKVAPEADTASPEEGGDEIKESLETFKAYVEAYLGHVREFLESRFPPVEGQDS